VHEVFYCGSDSDRRFAYYHPPTGADRSELIVVCPPLLSEYMRTYAALREVAVALAERGWHVVRFDYRGTGDSSGELMDVALQDWFDDVVTVTSEAKDISRCRSVSALAVRVGALIALGAQRDQTMFDRLVLWDPVLSGAEYLAAFTARSLKRTSVRGHPTPNLSEGRSLGGYMVPPGLVSSLERLRERDLELAGAHVSGVNTAAERQGWAAEYGLTTVAYDCEWDASGEDLMTPRPVLEAIIEAFVARRA
jgi:pimeloyl-ACP methyl ester carboxylesterase